MEPVWQDSHGMLWNAHILDALAAMEPESVQCVVTSPPYWGLRSYGTDPVLWGNHNGCDHALEATRHPRTTGIASASSKQNSNRGAMLGTAFEPTAAGKVITGGTGRASAKQLTNAGSQYGNAFEPIRAPWANEMPGPSDNVPKNQNSRSRLPTAGAACAKCGAWAGELGSEPLHDCAGWATGAPCGACFVCHLVEVFAAVKRVLRPDGVCLVNLGDSYNSATQMNHHSAGLGDAKRYSEGARGDWPGHRPLAPGLKPKDLVGIPWRFALAMQAAGWWLRGDYIWSKPNPMPESVTDRCTRSHEYLFHFSKSERYYWDAAAISEASVMQPQNRYTRRAEHPKGDDGRPVHRRPEGATAPAGRNKRSVWEVATHAYPEAHFATFPPALVKPCVLAGCPPGGVVLDPFAGSGTSLLVAREMGRVGWGVELNPAYCDLAIKRLRQHVLF